MTSYGARIFDLASGRFIFSAPGVASPYRVGQVAAGAVAALVARDGLRAEDLELHSFVAEGSAFRPMTGPEAAAMEAAFEQFATGRNTAIAGARIRRPRSAAATAEPIR
jgi:hypothetical protein